MYPPHGLQDDEGAANEGIGTLLIPNTVARIKGGPNPAHAATLIDFLLSEEVERMLAESTSHNIPLREALQDSYAQYAAPDPLKVDWERAAALRTKAIEQFFNAMEVVKQERAAEAEMDRASTQPDEQPDSREPGDGGA
jgi:ABC-type Fe3+ transport system substrate-binding protein